MKKILIISFVFVTLSTLFACNSSETKNTDTQNTTSVKKDSITANTIQVYYFHGSIRCHTCVSVDENTHQYIKDLFPVKLDKGDIIFKSINIDKDERPDLVKKYQIYGQTLLFIKGDKVINLTDDAFKYVSTNPEKWKQIVEDITNDLIN